MSAGCVVERRRLLAKGPCIGRSQIGDKHSTGKAQGQAAKQPLLTAQASSAWLGLVGPIMPSESMSTPMGCAGRLAPELHI